MKFALVLLFSLPCLALAQSAESFSAYSQSGLMGLCSSNASNSNEYIQASHYKNIIEAAKIAKSDCEDATEKVCGIITLRAKDMPSPNRGCYGYAVAKPIN